MSNQALFAQVIADAKAVREAALANAKAALEETFAPRIKEMISLKLSEELDEDLDEVKDEVEEGIEEYRIKKPASKVEMQEKADKDEDDRIKEGDDQVDETYDMEESLDEILAELEALDEDEKSKGMGETKSDDSMMEATEEDPMEEAKDEEGEEDAEDESEEDKEGGEEITELTVDELKDIIHDVVAELMGQSGEAKSQEMLAGEEVSDMEVTDIDEMLSELDEESNDENIYEAKKVKTKAEKAKEKAAEEKAEKAEKKAEKAEKELKEAISVIKTLKESINEVNLLNAKLLYVNKIFKAKSLAESQKVKVINAFDRATTINEVKNIYSTIKESISEVKKTGLQESIGFASKAIGNAPKQIIVEGDAVINRLQKLAGIIK